MPAPTRRFGTETPSKRKLGVTPRQLEVIVAVGTCEIVHGGLPTRSAVQQVAGVGDNAFADVVSLGYIEAQGRTVEGFAVYRVAVKGWRVLDLEPVREAGAAE